MAQAFVEIRQQGPAASQDDAAIHDVGGQLGRRLVERRLDRLDDLLHRLVERAPHLLGAEHHGLRQAGEHVPPPDLSLQLFAHVVGRADLELDLLCCLLPDQQLVLALDVIDDRLVHLVAAHAQRLRDDDPAQGDDGDLGRAAADVDNHVSRRLRDRKSRADRGGHRLLDQVRLSRARAERCLFHRTLLHACDAGRNADDDARMCKAVLVHLLDEVTQHLLRHVEVGDDAVLERADCGDRPGRAAEHPLRLDTDGVHLACALVDRDDRGFREHDPAPSDVHECVRGPEVHGHIAAAEAAQIVEETHEAVRV